MKTLHRIAILTIVTGLTSALPMVSAAADTQAALMAEARVTGAQARAAALAKVPHGTVQSAELEKEHGRLIWSFDIASPSVKGMTEVQVDAKTGKIALVKKETPAQEAREAGAEGIKPK